MKDWKQTDVPAQLQMFEKVLNQKSSANYNIILELKTLSQFSSKFIFLKISIFCCRRKILISILIIFLACPNKFCQKKSL
jgi:hypothetical protein